MAEGSESKNTSGMADGAVDGRSSKRENHSEQMIDPWCEPCLEDTRKKIEAICYCPTCNVCFCRACDESHKKMPISQHHRVLRGSKMPKSHAEKTVQYSDCTLHNGNKSDLYCFVHRRMVCDDCLNQDHESCGALPISDVCKSLGLEDVIKFKSLIDFMKSNLKTMKTECESNASELEKQGEHMLKKAEQERDKVIYNANRLFLETEGIITEMRDKKKFQMNEQIVTLTDAIHSLDSIIYNIQKKTHATTAVDPNMFIQMQQLVANARDFKREIGDITDKLHKIELSFVPSKVISAVLDKTATLGDICEEMKAIGAMKDVGDIRFPFSSPVRKKSRTLLSAFSHKSKTEQKIPVDKQKGISRLSLKRLPSFNVRTHTDEDKCNISGITVTANGTILLVDYSNKSVKVFTDAGRCLSAVPFDSRCYDVAVASPKTAVVSSSDKKLHVLNISDPTCTSEHDSMALGYLIIGITPYKDKFIVTSWEEPKSVKMIDRNGQEVWSVSKDPHEQLLFDKPLHAMAFEMIDRNAVVVSDWAKETLTLLDAGTGNLLKTVGLNSKQPFGLTVGTDGNIFVCYRGSREICVWSNDLSKSVTLLADQDIRSEPTDIAYNRNTNQLFISYYKTDEIDRFQILLAK